METDWKEPSVTEKQYKQAIEQVELWTNIIKQYEKENNVSSQLEPPVMPKIADTKDLEKAYAQCCDCFSNWEYRGKQDQGWCYSQREYVANCPKYYGRRS